MSSDFDKDALEVERNYSHNWLTIRSARFMIKHNIWWFKLAEWLVGYANVLRMASDRDGYEWVDRRTSDWSQMDDRQKVREVNKSLNEEEQNAGLL